MRVIKSETDKLRRCLDAAIGELAAVAYLHWIACASFRHTSRHIRRAFLGSLARHLDRYPSRPARNKRATVLR